MFIVALIGIIFISLVLGVLWLISPFAVRLQEKDYLKYEYPELIDKIKEEPIKEYKLHVSHSQVCGYLSAPDRGVRSSIMGTKVICYEKFLVIELAKLATKISYNEEVDFKESNMLGYYFGNIVFFKNGLTYNIVTKDPNDFQSIKNVIENYKKAK